MNRRGKNGAPKGPSGRIALLTAIFIILAAVLIQRLFTLQIIQGKDFISSFQSRTTKTRVIKSARGKIYDRNGKLIASAILPMDELPSEIWIQTEDIAGYKDRQADLFDLIREYPGQDRIVVYSRKEKAIKRLPSYQNIFAGPDITDRLARIFGKDNVVIRETGISW